MSKNSLPLPTVRLVYRIRMRRTTDTNLLRKMYRNGLSILALDAYSVDKTVKDNISTQSEKKKTLPPASQEENLPLLAISKTRFDFYEFV